MTDTDKLLVVGEGGRPLDECQICFQMPKATAWSCPELLVHTVCAECLELYIQSKLADGAALVRCPFPGCSHVLDPAKLPTLPNQATVEALRTAMQMSRNPKMRPCPACSALTEGNPRKPDMTCSRCSESFCFYHGADHPGVSCNPPSISPFAAIRNAVWRWRNTRKCPQCKADIEKNGGCDHMTCRCGFEICWRCGDPYRRHGRAGHMNDLFPSPRNLRYCCSTPWIWTQRVLVVAVAAPVAVLAVPYFLLRTVWRGINAVREAVREWRRVRARRNLIPANVRRDCDQFHREHPARSACWGCDRGGNCAHFYGDPVTPPAAPGAEAPRVCVMCNHFQAAPSIGCSHYYSDRIPHRCMFCHQPRPGHPQPPAGEAEDTAAPAAAPAVPAVSAAAAAIATVMSRKDMLLWPPAMAREELLAAPMK